MCNTTTLLLVTLLATVLSTFPSPATAQVPSPWCRTYIANCEALRKLNCDAKVNGDRNLTWISAQCSIGIPAPGKCNYFSPDCSCSYTDLANNNRTVMIPLSQPALELTQNQTNNGCVDGNANSTRSTTPAATATIPITTALGSPTTTMTPTATTQPNMAGDSKKPMAVSLATLNVAILIALFL
ncbi:hypothetical protein EC957_008147 [Mortierella hygrophila]|uniref:Uncharacterized protein n=1 Tax=Mortierella hygrophila TaxID=979708 RepID=A0A9P6K8L7_9FUNG|nr:hypothetical protein EC957_008147 [Mortierella hygrophila]